MSFFHQNRWK